MLPAVASIVFACFREKSAAAESIPPSDETPICSKPYPGSSIGRPTQQGRAAIGEQIQIDQFLFHLLGGGIRQRVDHFVQEQVAEPFAGAVQELAGGRGGQRFAELGRE